MTKYLILKLEGDDPRSATITTLVDFEGEAVDAVKQGFSGEGRYAIVNWDERVECDLVQGPVEATALEDREVRAKKEEDAEKAAAEAASEK